MNQCWSLCIIFEHKSALQHYLCSADSVLYSRELQPRMIIEYKAPHIPITQKVFDQISVYNLLLHVDFLVVSNGLEHYICKMDYESKKYVFLETIPDYSDLLTL